MESKKTQDQGWRRVVPSFDKETTHTRALLNEIQGIDEKMYRQWMREKIVWIFIIQVTYDHWNHL